MNKLKLIRKEQGLTLEEVGDKLPTISKPMLSRYERGDVNVKPEKWEELAQFYGVTVAYLMGHDDNQYSDEDYEKAMAELDKFQNLQLLDERLQELTKTQGSDENTKLIELLVRILKDDDTEPIAHNLRCILLEIDGLQFLKLSGPDKGKTDADHIIDAMAEMMNSVMEISKEFIRQTNPATE